MVLKYFNQIIQAFKNKVRQQHRPLTLTKAYQQVIDQTRIVPLILLEIGSRDGIDAHELSKLFGILPTNVFVVEANPYCTENIRRDFPHFKIFEKAIFNTNKPLYFNKIEGADSGVSSLKNRVDNYYEGKAVQIKVETETGEVFLNKNQINQIDVCKIDVEGCTLEVLQSFGESLTRIKTIHIECEHREVWQNQFLFEDVNAFLISKGYKCLYFSFVEGGNLQSDSIWVLKDFIIKNEN